MLPALALSLALALTPRCVEVEVVAHGRSAHGSSIMPEAAPHLLIKSLSRLPDWVENSASASAARITNLEAAPAVNVIPRRAAAIVDISLAEGILDEGAWVAELAGVLGSRVEVELLTTPCRPVSRPGS